MGSADTVAASGTTAIRGFERQNRGKRAGLHACGNYRSILNHVDLVSVGEDARNIIRSGVHYVPQFKIASAWLKVHERAASLELVILLGIQIQCDVTGRVLRLHLPDSANGDHHVG